MADVLTILEARACECRPMWDCDRCLAVNEIRLWQSVAVRELDFQATEIKTETVRLMYNALRWISTAKVAKSIRMIALIALGDEKDPLGEGPDDEVNPELEEYCRLIENARERPTESDTVRILRDINARQRKIITNQKEEIRSLETLRTENDTLLEDYKGVLTAVQRLEAEREALSAAIEAQCELPLPCLAPHLAIHPDVEKAYTLGARMFVSRLQAKLAWVGQQPKREAPRAPLPTPEDSEFYVNDAGDVIQTVGDTPRMLDEVEIVTALNARNDEIGSLRAANASFSSLPQECTAPSAPRPLGRIEEFFINDGGEVVQRLGPVGDAWQRLDDADVVAELNARNDEIVRLRGVPFERGPDGEPNGPDIGAFMDLQTEVERGKGAFLALSDRNTSLHNELEAERAELPPCGHGVWIVRIHASASDHCGWCELIAESKKTSDALSEQRRANQRLETLFDAIEGAMEPVKHWFDGDGEIPMSDLAVVLTDFVVDLQADRIEVMSLRAKLAPYTAKWRLDREGSTYALDIIDWQGYLQSQLGIARMRLAALDWLAPALMEDLAPSVRDRLQRCLEPIPAFSGLSESTRVAAKVES